MTPTQSPVADAERRAWNYWFVDGLPNLIAGVACLLISATLILLVHYRKTRSPFILALALLAIVIGSSVFIRLRWTLEWLKTRITYTRTGFAAPPYFTDDPKPSSDLAMLNLSTATEKETMREILVSEDTRRRLWFFLGILMAAALVAGFIHNLLICTFAGVLTGASILIASRKDPRSSWAAVYSLPFAVVMSMEFVRLRMERVGFFMSGVGIALVSAGAIALARYLRRNPARRT
ncbi:MAG TPA: hypothetical protein VE077_16340 [Candidatus Methylomirabilis sp.]|nr:hypothetical protein [Candidatus Methylomirabilis sp.]